jgi:CRISPR system Cascade subunit CasE
MAWLLQRAESWGVQFPLSSAATEDDDPPPADVRINARSRRSFQRRTKDPRVVLQVVTYEGHLVVKDAERLRHLLLAGIGRAKAYGCGLLTLAPSGRD